jgi:hypothetical protein
VPPGTKNSKGYWTPKDCYHLIPLIISSREAKYIWEETEWVVNRMTDDSFYRTFYRNDLKAGPHSCSSCFYRNLCKAELENGELTDMDLKILAPTQRERITLPHKWDIPR